MLLKLYLVFNALMYAVFGVWCALAPRTTSEYLGLSSVTPGGESEYLAVYGGLQVGLACFFGLAAASEEHRRAALWMSACLYGGIVIFRTIAVARLGFAAIGNARYFYCGEIVLALVAFALLARKTS